MSELGVTVDTDSDVSRRARSRRPADRLTYTVRELANALGVSEHTVRRYIAAGLLKTVRLGGYRLVLAESVQALLSEAK